MIKATTNPDAISEEFKSTYLYIPLKLDIANADLNICADTGASLTLISKTWLKQYGKKVCYKSINPCIVIGIKLTFTINRQAIFNFYIPGTVQGKAIH